MRKVLMAILVVSVAALSPSAASAAAWYVPTNVRVVQKSNVDTNNRVYGSIQQAINSITNASASNPYLVKVMPGVYSENVVMKPYVSLIGAGQDTTQIVGQGGSTVVGASGAEISELTIVGSGSWSAIVNSDATPRIKDVTISVPGDSGAGYPSIGIYNYASGGDIGTVLIDNVRISIPNGNGGGATGISSYGRVTTVVRNSTINITTPNTGAGVSFYGVFSNMYSSVLVDASDITVTVNGTTGGAGVAGVNAQFATIKNSTISVNSDGQNASGVSLFGGSDVVTRISNTSLEATTPIVNSGYAVIRCANAYDANLARVCP